MNIGEIFILIIGILVGWRLVQSRKDKAEGKVYTWKDGRRVLLKSK